MEEKNYCVYLHTVLQKVSGYKYKKYYQYEKHPYLYHGSRYNGSLQ